MPPSSGYYNPTAQRHWTDLEKDRNSWLVVQINGNLIGFWVTTGCSSWNKRSIQFNSIYTFFNFVVGFPYLFSQHVLCVFTFIIWLYYVFYNMLTYILWFIYRFVSLLLNRFAHLFPFFNNVFMSLNPCTKKIWRNKSHIKVYTKEVIVSLQLIVLHSDLYYIVANK